MVFLFSYNPTKIKAPKNTNRISQPISQSTKSTIIDANSLNLKVADGGKTIRYHGQAGHTAFDLLARIAKVEIKFSKSKLIVSSINGLKAQDNESWTFFINSQKPKEAADKFQTEDSDKIEWQLNLK